MNHQSLIGLGLGVDDRAWKAVSAVEIASLSYVLVSH